MLLTWPAMYRRLPPCSRYVVAKPGLCKAKFSNSRAVLLDITMLHLAVPVCHAEAAIGGCARQAIQMPACHAQGCEKT